MTSAAAALLVVLTLPPAHHQEEQYLINGVPIETHLQVPLLRVRSCFARFSQAASSSHTRTYLPWQQQHQQTWPEELAGQLRHASDGGALQGLAMCLATPMEAPEPTVPTSLRTLLAASSTGGGIAEGASRQAKQGRAHNQRALARGVTRGLEEESKEKDVKDVKARTGFAFDASQRRRRRVVRIPRLSGC
jgi:hypothetical protein